jgi:hypothetical protein
LDDKSFILIDLTGANLVAYLLKVIRDIVERHPRFKETLGEVTFPANTIIRWKDVGITIRSVSTSGTRLSPDYFMCTQRGRAILTKVTDKEGQLVEWVRETDRTRQTPEPGVYYINVDFFDEQTRDIGLTCQKFKWVEGKITDAEGSSVHFRPGIDVNTLDMHDSKTGATVEFNGFNQTVGAFAYLLTPVEQLVVNFTNPSTHVVSPLVPFTDYWYERKQTTVICQSTLGGSEIVSVPTPYISVKFFDQDGYELRQGIDYSFYGEGFIKLAQWTPAGSTISATAVVKLNPYLSLGTNPENIFNIGLLPGESLAPGEIFIHTTSGDFPGAGVGLDGTITLPMLLQPGEWARWEVRIQTPQVKAIAKKWELNSLTVVDPLTIKYARRDRQGVLQPVPAEALAQATPEQLAGVAQTSAGLPLLDASGKQQFVLPGLVLAIGDQVVVGDQVAIIVSPSLTETYEVFGSKENISFTLEIKANDLQTASDLAEMLKQQLLITRRENTEADGLTIFEATRDYQGQQRDPSATASSYVYTVSVSASADWKVYVPLVTRLVQFEISTTTSNPDFQGKLQMANRMTALGATQFIPSYQ